MNSNLHKHAKVRSAALPAQDLLALSTHDVSPQALLENDQLTVFLSHGKDHESNFPVIIVALKRPLSDNSEQAVLCVELRGSDTNCSDFLKSLDLEIKMLSSIRDGLDEVDAFAAQKFLHQIELEAQLKQLPVYCYDPAHGNSPIPLSEVTYDPTLDDSPAHRLVHGLPTRAALESEEFMAEINKQVPGRKVFCVFDFKHMRVGNGLGLRENIDELLGSLKGIAQDTLGDRAMLFSLGGDEFGIMIKQESGLSEPLLRNFFKAITDKRDEILDQDKGMHLAARKMAAVRSAARSIFVDIQEELDPGLASNAKIDARPNFTVEKYVEIARARLDANKVKYHENDDAGSLTLKLADCAIDRGDYPGEVPILGLSKGYCRTGSEPNPGRMKLVYSIAAKDMDKGQGDSIPDLSKVQTPRDQIANRRSDILSLELTAQAEELYKHARKTLSIIKEGQAHFRSLTAYVAAASALVHAQARAPDVGYGVLLASLVNDRALRHFGIHQDAEYFATVVDIPGFSAINNNEGPDRSDGFINTNAKILRENYPGALICRKNGKLLLLTPTEPRSLQLDGIQKGMSDSLKSGLFKQQAEVEYLINEHINQRMEPNSSRSQKPIPPFGDVIISKPKSVLVSSKSLGQGVFEQIEEF